MVQLLLTFLFLLILQVYPMVLLIPLVRNLLLVLMVLEDLELLMRHFLLCLQLVLLVLHLQLDLGILLDLKVPLVP